MTDRVSAVVVGASVAGMAAARVLADHFERVLLLERDQLPDSAVPRPGVPQAHHVHALLAAGQQGLERLFPGVLDQLRAAGATPLDMSGDIRQINAWGPRQRFSGRHVLLSCSRALLDSVLRGRLAEVRGVEVRTGCEVTGLLATGTGRRAVTGVHVRNRGDGATEQIDASLVVDASGRGSRTPDWLAALGLPRPPETLVDAGFAYASRRYRIPAGLEPGWLSLVVLPGSLAAPRVGMLFPIEGRRWLVTLIGGGADQPPTDPEGFLAFARRLRSPELYEAIAAAEPEAERVAGFRRTANHRRHYESMRGRPAGLVVLGDAGCALNPLYGQGMSVAVQSAHRLDAALRRSRSDPQRAVAGAVNDAWALSTENDSRYPHTTGARRGLPIRLKHRYLNRVLAAANRDPYVCDVLLAVNSLVAPPRALFRPGVARRIVRRG